MTMLIAQGTEAFDLFKLIGSIGVPSALLLWVFVKWMPDRDAKHDATLRQQLQDFRAEMAEERKTTAELRGTFQSALQQISDRHRDHMQAMWSRVDEMLKQRAGEMQALLDTVRGDDK